MTKLIVSFITIIYGLILASALNAAEPKITVIVKSSESEYWQIVMDGVKVAGEEFGASVTIQGPVAESDIDKQISMVENAISTKPDAIILAPSASEPLVPVIERAAEAGIPLILIDSAASTEKFSAFLSSDNEKIGILAAEEMASSLKRRYGKASGKIAGISFISGASSLELRKKGFIETITKKYPDIEIVDFRDAQGKIGIAINIAQDYLTTYKDLRGIFASNQPTGDETVRALDIEGRKDLSVVVVDAGPNEVWGMKNGIVDSIIAQKPWIMGYMGVEYALKAIKGEKLEKFVDTGIISITQEMIKDVSIDKLIYPVSFYEQKKQGQ